jgi:hypothetical protein
VWALEGYMLLVGEAVQKDVMVIVLSDVRGMMIAFD